MASMFDLESEAGSMTVAEDSFSTPGIVPDNDPNSLLNVFTKLGGQALTAWASSYNKPESGGPRTLFTVGHSLDTRTQNMMTLGIVVGIGLLAFLLLRK